MTIDGPRPDRAKQAATEGAAMTTDTTALQERIARALRETLTDPYGAGSDLESPGITSEGTVWQRGGEIDVPHMVDDLLPIIAAEVRAAKAEALRKIAPHLNDSGDESFLLAAATEYETGDQA